MQPQNRKTMTWLPILIFVTVFALIVFEVVDKAILAIAGAVLMVLFGFLDFHEAIASIEFETIILLMSMMLLVEVSRESGIFSWLTVKIAQKSKGNPVLIFLLFALITDQKLLNLRKLSLNMLPLECQEPRHYCKLL